MAFHLCVLSISEAKASLSFLRFFFALQSTTTCLPAPRLLYTIDPLASSLFPLDVIIGSSALSTQCIILTKKGTWSYN